MKKKVFSLMMTLVLAFMGMLQAQTQTTLSFGFEEGSLPSGWTKEGPGSWVVTSGDYSSSTGTHTGTYNALCSHSSTGVITYLVTDAMDFSGVTEGTINCWFINRSWAGDTDEFGVYYRVNNGSWNELYYTSSAHQSWSEMGEIALTGFAANYQIGFKMKDNYGYGVGLDDITITTTAGGDEPGGDEPDEPGYVYTDGLHVMSADGTIDTVNVGSRPLNAWMAPYVFKMYNDGDEDYTVTVLDFTPNDGIFENLTEVSFELPAGDTTDIAIDVNATAAGAVERQFVAIYQNTREAHIWPIIAEVYTPEVPDVYELSYDFGTIEPGFEYVGIPADITPTELHNDYTLPYPEIPEGVDGVYKMTFDKAVMLSARVSQGENGKVALYTEDFYGEEGPMATNNYTERPFNGGGGSSAGGELTVHDGEITNSYVPVYGFNADNCLKAEMVYSAAELSDMSGKNINSMKFYLQQTASQGNPWTGPFQVFMKEVAGATISSFEGLSGATIVYEGAIDGTTSEVTLNFTTPYHYNGGNLLVGVYQTTYHSMVGWGSAYFYGETISGASINGYGSSLEGITSPTQRNFLPKTTFAYGNRSFDRVLDENILAKMAADPTIERCGNSTNSTNVSMVGNRAPWDLMASFTGTSGGQQAVATDGNYIYTASWQTTPAGGYTFYQYDMTGTFIEGFNIEGATGIRDLTTDGTYFYGTSGGANLFVLDFNTRTLVNTITCSGLTSRHVSYDPERDGFWSGNWSTLALYDRNGALVQSAPAPSSAYGSAYYKDENDEEHLYLFCQPSSTAKVFDYNITTNTLNSSPLFSFTDNLDGCTGIAGGCFIGNYNGKIAFFGNVQQEPNLIGIYELIDAPVEPEPEEPVAGVGPEIDSLNVLPGTYYLVASSTDADFEVTINIDELPCPEQAIAVYPADNADGIEPASVTLKWQLSPYCTEYRLVFSSTYWPDDEPNNPFTIITEWSNNLAEEYTVTNLFNNTNYFWRIDQRTNGGEENGGCTTTGEVFGFTTHLNIPHQLTATPDQIFEGQTVTLNWTSVVDRTYRYYYIYKDGEKIGETTVNQINQNSFVVPASELTYNMEGYVFNVTAVYDEGESDFSNDAIVKVSGYSNATGINGYAYEQDGETPIADVTVTITGTDEFNNSHTYTATTDENGYYHVQVYVGHYTMAIANKDGYQETVTNHVLPFDVALNDQVDNVDFIMDEVFYAPSHVCAELVNVGEVDELVKVWWDFGGGSGASGELTVFDGTATESHVPIYGFDADYCLKSEMIMPAADLAPMTGSDINSMKWYITSPSTQSGAWDGPFTIFMKEVSSTTLSSYQGMDGATIVYQGAIDAHTTAEPYIEFTTPYRYNGGNLLIGVYKDVYQSLQGWGSATFMGETHTGASIWGYGQTSNGITATQANFLPKTTFVYGNRENREVAMNRSLHHYNIYRTDCYNDGPYNDTNTVLLATAWVPDTAYIDVSWPEAEPGVYKWGVSAVYQGNRVEYPAGPRESDIVWHTDCAPCIDKDMETQVTVNVLLNSADSPEGTVVSFTNLNELEQQAHPQPSVTLDESGFYAFENFRKGDYQVKVEHLGYESIIDEPVSIWEPTDLRYVMIEIHFPIQNIYVSRTGWAMWDEPDMSGTTPSGGNTIIDFETGDFSQYTFDNTISSYPWTVVQEGNDGYCMKSANAGVASSTSAIEASKNFGSDGMVSFDALCQGEGTSTHWDKCQFFIDGVEMMNHGAEVSGWNNYSYPVTAGEHTFKWSYTKDGSVNPTGDCFKVDNISFTIGRESNEERHLEYYKVLCTSIDGVPIYNHNTVHPFCQLSTNEPYNAPLVEGEHYLCKVAVMYSTGMSEWSEPVEWEYEPCDHWGPVDEVTENTTTQGNHIEWVFEHGFNPYGGDTPTPDPEPGESFEDDFEAGNLSNWTTLDADNDGDTWQIATPAAYGIGDAHSGTYCASSWSWNNYSMDPDNWMISPEVAGATSISYFVATNTAYPDHYAIMASSTGTNASDFTLVFEEDAPASKGVAANGVKSSTTHAGDRAMSSWNARTVDLPAGTKYVAFRHYNSYDMNYLFIDDVTIATSAKGGYSFDKGGEFYTQYADEGVLLNFFAEDNVYFRAFFLYTLSNDSRFTVTPENEYGKFIVNPAYEMDNFMGEFEDFYKNAITDFGLMDKVEVTEANGIWKSNITPAHYLSIMMDVYTIHSRTENDHCINSLPFCTSEVIEFPAAHDGGATADENAEFGCVLSQPYPSWYHMRIETAGQFVIHMEAHDPDNPGSNRDIDYCLWGPFTDPYAPCANDLTCEKIIDCSYSTASVEDAYLGYPLSEHDHGGSSLADGSCITYHVPEVGEYYILMITNYSQQQCNISFTKTEGEGETDCDIVTPTNILGFLITKDGEYLAFADANVRDYTDVDEFGEHEYCVRPIYPGEMELPDHNYGWSMGCPVCAVPEVIEDCAPVTNLNGYYQNTPEFGEAIFIEWDEPEGVVSYELYIGGELADTFEPGGLPLVIYGLEGYPALTLPIGVVAVYPDCQSEMVTVNVNYDEVPENQAEIALFPNPTKDNVTIKAAGMRHITVTSVLGQVVYDAEVDDNEVILNMSQYNAGVYMVRVVTANGVGTRRVTVVR